MLNVDDERPKAERPDDPGRCDSVNVPVVPVDPGPDPGPESVDDAGPLSVDAEEGLADERVEGALEGCVGPGVVLGEVDDEDACEPLTSCAYPPPLPPFPPYRCCCWAC